MRVRAIPNYISARYCMNETNDIKFSIQICRQSHAHDHLTPRSKSGTNPSLTRSTRSANLFYINQIFIRKQVNHLVECCVTFRKRYNAQFHSNFNFTRHRFRRSVSTFDLKRYSSADRQPRERHSETITFIRYFYGFDSADNDSGDEQTIWCVFFFFYFICVMFESVTI